MENKFVVLTEKELTLFTCSQKGTMRFVVRCIYKEVVMDE